MLSPALLESWVDFLVFNLFIDTWIYRTARQPQLAFWLVIASLPLPLLLGPARLLLFSLPRLIDSNKQVSGESSWQASSGCCAASC